MSRRKAKNNNKKRCDNDSGHSDDDFVDCPPAKRPKKEAPSQKKTTDTKRLSVDERLYHKAIEQSHPPLEEQQQQVSKQPDKLINITSLNKDTPSLSIVPKPHPQRSPIIRIGLSRHAKVKSLHKPSSLS